MKIQLLSDLHLERYPHWQPRPVPGAEVLVLAGDIGSYQAGSLLTEGDFGLTRFSPRQPGCPWQHVLFVPGNHEFDSLELEPTRQRLRELCAQLGITWLDREVVTLGDVRFVGTTLWSDFDAFACQEKSLVGQLTVRDKAFRAANFYLRKNTTLVRGEPLLAEAMRELSLSCQAWLRDALAAPFDGRTVVVTHFAPTLNSADPRYGLTPGTAGFCNALDALLPHADLWLHGHLHCPNDHVIKGSLPDGRAWQCRVVANPLGYVSKGEQATHRTDLLIELR